MFSCTYDYGYDCYFVWGKKTENLAKAQKMLKNYQNPILIQIGLPHTLTSI